MAPPRITTADGFELQMATNHFGPFAFTGLLIDALHGARVVTVSSGMHRSGKIAFDDLQSERDYHRWQVYSQTKLANLLFTFELGRRAAAAGLELRSVAAHPGIARTNLQAAGPGMDGNRLRQAIIVGGTHLIGQSDAKGALPSLYAATVPDLPSGTYVGPNGLFEGRGHPKIVSASKAAHDEAVARRLWEASREADRRELPVIAPVQSGAALLADVRAADPDRLHLWWLGQSGFLVAWAGRHLLLDPYLSDSLTRKYADTDKPHVRMTALVVEPSELAFVDVVTASHAHTDHLDPDTLQALARRSGRGAGGPPRSGRSSGRAARRWASTTARPSRSRASRSPPCRPPTTRSSTTTPGGCCTSATWCAAGPYAIYHAGDTIPYDDLAERVRAVADIDVALLPINGRRPERRVAGNLWGDEAAAVAHAIGARLAVPMHFEQFEFNTEPPDAFVAACERLGQPYRVLRAGERLTVDQPE